MKLTLCLTDDPEDESDETINAPLVRDNGESAVVADNSTTLITHRTDSPEL